MNRFNDELEQIKTKDSIGGKRVAVQNTREQSILMTIESERDEYKTIGIDVPDLTSLENLKSFKHVTSILMSHLSNLFLLYFREWKQEWSQLPLVKLRKIKSQNV